jgi:DNA-binding transcriptional ArsR family regulator
MRDANREAPELRTRLAKALSHPLRQRLLMAYYERVTSPRELADDLGEQLNAVSYHTQHLLRHGFLELVRTEKRRGATKHYYRAVVRPEIYDDEWVSLPESLRRGIAGAIVAEIWLDLLDAQAAGRLDAEGIHLARTPLELDDRGWDELSTLLRETGHAALRIESESAERSPSRARRRSMLALLHVPRA